MVILLDLQEYSCLVVGLMFVMGASFGSFVTLASYRLPRTMAVVRGRSMCPACKTSLKIADLFPLFSWLFTGGKCRHCGTKIDVRYPLIELLLGILFVLLYWQYGLTVQTVLLALFVTSLMVLIVADMETGLLPDEAQACLLLLGIVYVYLMDVDYVLHAFGCIAGLVIGLGLRFGYRHLKKQEGLGLGDVKFFAVAGLWLGLEGMVTFFLLAGILGIMTALLWRMLGKGKVFPFGPALAISLGVCVIFPGLQEYVLHGIGAWYMP